MGSSRKKIGLLEIFGYLLGGAMLMLAAMSASGPTYLSIGLAAAGLLVILGTVTFLGNRRILPVGVTRDGDVVVCRYIPWYELNSLTIFVLTPAIGFAALSAGSAPGRPVWLQVAGLIVLCCVLVTGFFVGRMWRQCLVKISPSTLTFRLPVRGAQLTEIPRSGIQSITAADAEVGAVFAPVTVTQVAVNYQSAGESAGAATVLIGPPPGKTALQISVQPTNVYNALLAWKDADPDDPHLMDRTEAILRGKEPARL